MALDKQIKYDLLQQTIYVHAPSSIGNAGESAYSGSPASRAARVELETGITTGTDNEEISYKYKILTESEIVRYSRVWLPGVSQSDAGLALLVLNNEPITGEKGENCGWWAYA